MEDYNHIYDALTEYQEGLVEECVEEVQFIQAGKKTTIALVTLVNGFELVGTSACVDPVNFDTQIGEAYAFADAISKLDELLGFYRQMEMYHNN
jgi:hypothetical protein